MSLSTIIDKIDMAVGNNAPQSQIKGLLVQLREQAEALDGKVKVLEAEAQHVVPESDFNDLKRERDELKDDRAVLRGKLEKAQQELIDLKTPRSSSSGLQGMDPIKPINTWDN